MEPITTIASGLGAVKTAISIAKTISKSESELEAAELKLRMSELIGSLAEANIALVDAQEIIRERGTQIEGLNQALEFKGKLVRHRDAYYLADDNGNPKGMPFCLTCWDKQKEAIQLHKHPMSGHMCGSCERVYVSPLVPPMNQ